MNFEKPLLIAALLVYLNALPVSANCITDTVVIHSEILDEIRLIVVYKSETFVHTEPTSFLYMLDGEFAATRYSKIMESDSNNQTLGIAIINTKRNRDLLPVNEPAKFLGFIEKELIPIIESGYSVKNRILYGHSFAGGFSLYALINKPGLFDNYIASSPTPIMKMTDPSIYKELDTELSHHVGLYLSCGSEDLKQVKKWMQILVNNLKALSFENITWKSEVFEGENHNTSDKIAIVKGL